VRQADWHFSDGGKAGALMVRIALAVERLSGRSED
jgi:hypothetical protein